MRKTNFFAILFFILLVMQFNFLPNSIAVSGNNSNLKTSQIPISPIRIAIYDEANLTRPSYLSIGLMNNNHSLISSVFNSAGFTVTYLSTTDIFNHELMTAKYDVLVLNDNLPRENITNYILEFWLGGGSLLTFDSAVSFLCYFGILPPESDGDDGFMVYWNYLYSDNQSIYTRHPVSKAYEVSEIFSVDYFDWATFDWAALSGTSIASQLTRIATIDGDTNLVTVLGFEPEDQGGKVLHILSSYDFTGNQLLIDAVQWLCPRPKGRLIFDLSHEPYYGIDPWDDVSNYPNKYSTWRDDLVSRTYTIDKLYPSATGNLTSTRLAPYDVIIIVLPQLNFSTSEVTAVSNWITNGGSLLILGDNSFLLSENSHINHLLSSSNLQMNLTDDGVTAVDYLEIHPTTEGCTQLSFLFPGLVEYSGDAYPIWGNDAQKTTVAAQEYGKGRIILTSDINFLENSEIGSNDNRQYGINLINWLTAIEAEIVAFVHDPAPADPNDNIYRGPVAKALNNLGAKYLLTFNKIYLNLSLSQGSYRLVVIDNSETALFDTVGSTILEFLKAGGYMIVSTFEYRVASYNYLWDYIGFSYAGNYLTTPPVINIWNPTHPIFNSPTPYSNNTLGTSLNYINTDYVNLTLHSNATAIAGLTVTPDNSGVAIILGANGHVITNAMYLTEYYDDIDDSTYPDALEIWENEIAYIMSVIHPSTQAGIDLILILIIAGIAVAALAVVIIVVRKRKKS